MRLIFIGSGALACPALERLLDAGRDTVAAVITQPDRPRGRALRPAPCPVRERAAARGCDVLTPEKIAAPELLESLRARRPDLMIVAAYGQFLPAALLAIPPLGTLNIHPSLLPKYRGAAPIQWALANGDAETGVTICYVTPRMDAGNILAQEHATIGPADEDAAALETRLARLGAELLFQTLEKFRGGIPPVGIPQDETAVTFARKLTKDDGRLDWTLPAETIARRVRGFTPWPGVTAEIPAGSGRGVKILRADVEPGHGAPGAYLGCDPRRGPLFAAGRDALRLLRVQPAGKPAMTGAAYACGARWTG